MSLVSAVPAPEERWLSVKEASGILAVSSDTIRRMVRAGELKAWRLPSRSSRRKRMYQSLRIAYSEVMRFIRRNML